MQGTYKIQSGWKYFMILFGIGFVLGGVYLIIVQPNGANQRIVLTFIWLGMVIFGGLCINESLQTTLIIDQHSITVITGITNRSLLFKEVLGYKKGEKGNIFIIPMSENKMKLQISKYFENIDLIDTWVSLTFKDLDAEVLKVETEGVLSDEKLGESAEERGSKLELAKNITTLSNILVFAFLAWCLFYPTPNQIIMIIGILLPIVAIIITGIFNGLMRLEFKKNSAYPSVVMLILFPCIGLALRGMNDYHIYNYHNIYLPIATITVGLLIFCIVITQEAMVNIDKSISVFVFLAVVFCAYAYGVTVFVNGCYDKSTPIVYKVRVMNKRINYRRSSIYYYLSLSEWGNRNNDEETKVDRRFYKSVSVGDTIQVNLSKGRLNIEWYTFVQNN